MTFVFNPIKFVLFLTSHVLQQFEQNVEKVHFDLVEQFSVCHDYQEDGWYSGIPRSEKVALEDVR